MLFHIINFLIQIYMKNRNLDKMVFEIKRSSTAFDGIVTAGTQNVDGQKQFKDLNLN